MISINKKLFLNYLIVAYAFSLPISKAGTVFFSVLMIFLWLLEGNFKNKYNQVLNSLPIFLVLGLFLLSSISIIWSPDNVYFFKFMRKYWHFIPILIIFTSLNRKYIDYVLSGFFIGMFVSEIFLYGIYFELFSYKNTPIHDPSPFMDYMNYSVYLALTALLVLNKVVFVEQLKVKIFYLIFFILTVGSLFINAGRTGQVIFLFGIVVLAFLHIKHKFKAFCIILIFLTSLLTTVYFLSPNFKERSTFLVQDSINMLAHNNFNGSFGQRVSLWVIGTNIFKDNFVLGTGIGNELKGFDLYAKKFDFEHYVKMNLKSGFVDFHNSFVQYAAQLGILGLLLFLGIFYQLYKCKFRSKEFRNITIIFMVVFILQSLTLFTFHLFHSMVLFALFFPLLIKKAKLEENKL